MAASNNRKFNRKTVVNNESSNFFKDLVAEFKRITWASKEDVKKSSISVIAFCAVYVVIVGILDFGFNFIVKSILK
ncbi:preprotein translocase subunit SecE [Clostridium sp. cel8]|jgi:preprotein translocase subunit SecE|uniref:preprotein translocase subunit SecE n=1 Tax=unclassified Clostridium TaxID=2614128 RepID=UPI0015F51C01|nr:preprotein translocase subunit SecE [Clostridium sp. cel8]MBA5851780.1 preprotein translocase subunit SecE [Clostridium sp. cel8]